MAADKAVPFRHATAYVAGRTGILLIGPSGSGKTATALHHMEKIRSHGGFAAMIGDDQVAVAVVSGRVLASGAPTITGLAEIRGAGIAGIAAIGAGIVDVVGILVDASAVPRIPDAASHDVNGIALPAFALPAMDPVRAAAILAAAIHPALRRDL